MSAAAPPVAFHTGVVNPVEHALRLVRKASALGSRVLVIGPRQPMALLDEQLWVAEPGSFLAHARWSPSHQSRTACRLAPVWLMAPESETATELDDPAPDREVLINIGVSMPAAPERYAKVIEVVAVDPPAKALGQARWRAWRALGVQPAHHAFS